ncbi:MAG: DUF3267 domain-containing protein [Bacteroidia bacterium]|nr:DUF3267 domain-containing protein [Bacteroidia bacterium]
MPNPTIDELQNSVKYELIDKLSHPQIREFVMNQLTRNGRIVRIFMIYQVLMILTGIFFLSRSVVLAFYGNFLPLFYSVAALFFSFSLLIVVHELLHGLALKLTGARRVNFGGYLRKFIFYAEADRHVLNRKQFALVALTPLAVVKFICLAGIFVFFSQPGSLFFILTMSTHSLFCAGDIGLLSLFCQSRGNEIYTFDVKAEKTSYYYRKI